jgi:hypothetical protein
VRDLPEQGRVKAHWRKGRRPAIQFGTVCSSVGWPATEVAAYWLSSARPGWRRSPRVGCCTVLDALFHPVNTHFIATIGKHHHWAEPPKQAIVLRDFYPISLWLLIESPIHTLAGD